MIRKAMVLALLAMPLTAMAQAGGDLQAQIVYAYQTEDLNALSNLEDGLRAKIAAGEGDAALHYHLAHAAYRYATLAPREKGGAAGHAAGLCVDELKEILRRDERNVEALVLQSACYAQLAQTSAIEAVLLRTLASERLKKALHLAPRNPRAQLLAALAGPGPERPVAQLRAAAELFGQASSTAADVPGWGDADAYLALGQELQRRGDMLGARNWIERALIASPDYRAAQRARLELSGH
jgi:tetratricopeptide (TPR) repeat protein